MIPAMPVMQLYLPPRSTATEPVSTMSNPPLANLEREWSPIDTNDTNEKEEDERETESASA